ncbi:MAG: hypothetical protein V3S07_09640 [Micropepsaceae bacterium]
MTLKRIRLELARTSEFPEGSSARGYEFIAPLTQEDHIDADAWREQKDQCKVFRFWENEDDQHGKLRHVGQGWRFDYQEGETDDDEPFFKLDRHALAPGAYVSITEHDGEQLPFRVISVVPVGS